MVKYVHLKRWFLCLFILMLISIPVWAGEEGVVTGSVVNIRQGSSLAHQVVTQVKAGQTVAVLDKQGDWLYIQLTSGQKGWIHSDYVDISPTSGKKVIVNGSIVNLRQGPGTNYSRAGQVSNGTELVVLAEKDGWYKIQSPQGGQAWIAGWLAQEINSVPAPSTEQQFVIINTNVVNVRSGPGTNHAVVTKIGLNERHPILTQQNGWYKIQVGNQQGWVLGELVRLSSEGSDNLTPPSKNENNDTGASDQESYEKKVIVTGNVVNVRQSGDMGAPVIAKVYAGQQLSTLNKKGDWLQIQLASGQTGWIASWLIMPVPGELPDLPSRGGQEREVLSAPLADGKTFRIMDLAGRPILVLEGWSKNEYLIKNTDVSSLMLELKGPSTIKYQGKLSKVGISDINIYPKNNKSMVELTLTFPPVVNVSSDKNSTRIELAANQNNPIGGDGSLRGKVIVIDPGHAEIIPGGLKPGAVGSMTGLKEKDVNLSISLKLKSMLEGAGARVVMTHTGRTYLSLTQRTEVANNINADIFVSVHANSNDSPYIAGHSVYFYAPWNNPLLFVQRAQREKLATLVQRELVKAGGRRDIGVLDNKAFVVLRDTRVPSILVETAFLSNAEEERLLGDDTYRQQLAYGIFNGIKAYFR